MPSALLLLGLLPVDAIANWAGWLAVVVVVCVSVAAGIYFGLATVGGLSVLYRERCAERGLPYVRFRQRERVSGPSMLAARRYLRPNARLLPGELVEVKSLPEILSTLDERGCIEGLPFMPEMAAFCGHRFPVRRRVDKVWEYGHGTGLRRMRDAVLLGSLRCDGQSHGGCQSGCPVVWKEAWLKPAGMPSTPSRSSTPQLDLGAHTQKWVEGKLRYVCQMTQVKDASTQLPLWDVGHYWRDALSGNVRLGSLMAEIGIRLFNGLHWRIHGSVWPVMQPACASPAPHQSLGIQPGQIVRIKTKREIMATLNRGLRNRGLSFGADMLAYCGGSYRVAARINRVVHEGTGELLDLKNPSILLEHVTGIGGTVINPVDEYYFWREIWLDPLPDASAAGPSEASALASSVSE